MNYQPSGLMPQFHGDWKVKDFNTERQVIVKHAIGDKRVLSTRHVKKTSLEDVIFSMCDYFKPSWNFWNVNKNKNTKIHGNMCKKKCKYNVNMKIASTQHTTLHLHSCQNCTAVDSQRVPLQLTPESGGYHCHRHQPITFSKAASKQPQPDGTLIGHHCPCDLQETIKV